MKETFDVIVVGGSYAGLSAAMALGRALQKVLIIDGGMPANRFTPYSHNFITHDGRPPVEIASLARKQVAEYVTVKRMEGLLAQVEKEKHEFVVQLDSRQTYYTKKMIFATGIIDQLPDIPGLMDCWGKSVLHCPYCHGYEVRDETTGILGNGDYGFEFSGLISNWTRQLTLFTNGQSTLSPGQAAKIRHRQIPIVEKAIAQLDHHNGSLQRIIFKDGTATFIKALYVRPSFVQQCSIPEVLGCELTEDGYIKVDNSQRTTVHGVYACGDNTTRIRTVANAVAMGTTAGMMVNKELVMEEFEQA
ncbi:MAG: NAD(P)/FAD-dependent oxidoreductase [Cyclobacteriaceae bacterium]|jgi:thioredoxin reductase|nr:NAD(P)/FAD-dependent oxidoreductase [Cyclobacteriaceae bacterium]